LQGPVNCVKSSCVFESIISRVSRDSNWFQAHFKRFQEIARVSRVFQAFQEFQEHRPALEFQNRIKKRFVLNNCKPDVSRVSSAFEEFQETATGFKPISRGFKR